MNAPKRGRQAEQLHQRRAGDDREQGGEDEHLALAQIADQPEQGPQDEAPGQHQPDDRADRVEREQPARRAADIGRVAAHRGDDRDQRHDRQVLEQQDREGPLAERRPQPPRRSAAAAAPARSRTSASGRPSASAAAPVEPVASQTKAETARPHSTTCSRPKTKMSCRIRHSRAGLSSSPTRKSSRMMPSSATVRMLLGIGDQPQQMRPDQRAGDEIAQSRAQAELAEQQDEDEREAEQRHRDHQQRTDVVRGFVHAAAPQPRGQRRGLGHRLERQQDRAMPGRIAARHDQRLDPGPVAGIVAAGRRGSRERIPRRRQARRRVRPIACRPISAAEAWPSAQAFTSCPSAATRPGFIQREHRPSPGSRTPARAARRLPAPRRAAQDAESTPPAAGCRACKGARPCAAYNPRRAECTHPWSLRNRHPGLDPGPPTFAAPGRMKADAGSSPA